MSHFTSYALSTRRPAITAFSAALDPVVPGMASTWEAQLTAISTAVDTLTAMQAGANPLTREWPFWTATCPQSQILAR